ncbi:transcriptional regulator [Cenarchaeum symbiosum A]|uniref:Transcriptional regulator n=1 Tax=Cenarchaeum symbiosum (strain A) TaxID=414004 RepID=A0RUR6_CENSY|nr:transcriptional regulator [Cenarchaeum symbiosum A]
MIRPSRYTLRYARPSGSGIEDLRASIREQGLLQPILIRPQDHGFEIVAGHRRFAACRSLRWRVIPCRIRELTDRQAYEVQLAENIQRKSMDPIEEAEAYRRYVTEYGWGGVGELGKRIGKSEEYVSHRMQLLRLPEDLRERVAGGGMGVSQALELAGADEPLRTELAAEMASGGLTVRQIRDAKRRVAREPKPDGGTRSAAILNRGNLALKITLSRIDDLIEDARAVGPKERAELVRFLMELRLQTHSMIDETLKYKKRRPGRA